MAYWNQDKVGPRRITVSTNDFLVTPTPIQKLKTKERLKKLKTETGHIFGCLTYGRPQFHGDPKPLAPNRFLQPPLWCELVQEVEVVLESEL